jgi:hypothetical protein
MPRKVEEQYLVYLYRVFIGYAVVVVLYCVVLITVFVVKATGGFANITWDVFGKYFFGAAGLGVGTWFFKPVRDRLLKQNS